MENNINNSFFSSKGNRFLGTVALVALVIALASYATYTLKQSKYLYTGPVTISVSGVGEVAAVPDLGWFNFSVTAKGDDAAAAQEASGSKINSIIAYLKDSGVEEKDIKTENYNLYQKYRYEAEVCPEGSLCPQKRVPDGYEVSQMITVKVRDIDTAGSLIAGVGDLGATNISGLQFKIDDTDNLKIEARAQAIADAKAKARVLANELGVRVVKMVGYYEDESGPRPYYGIGGDMAIESAAKSFEAPELPTGENTISSRVTITYQVR
ncbi:MAG: SIMPL domain-containing protein [Candidatus Nomurabacteria bacterium]|nr:SIMPL domain-containing protein [Candidatus Nomurabacteria bacterium]USN88225.1 MAG: SIMPL domain-containing protein [Candidatus Nomurabacteria bacterium]